MSWSPFDNDKLSELMKHSWSWRGSMDFTANDPSKPGSSESSIDLTTDADGNAVAINSKPIADTKAREDIAKLDESVNGKVILPETEFAFNGESFVLMTPPSAYPEAGKTYVVTFNGQEYVLPVTVEDPGAYVFTGDDGGSEVIFVCVVFPDEFATQYGAYVGVETAAETCTISIVEKPAAVGGGVYVVNGEATLDMNTLNISGTFDKTVAEIVQAYNEGQIVYLRLTIAEFGMVLLMTASCYTENVLAWNGIVEGIIFMVTATADGELSGAGASLLG